MNVIHKKLKEITVRTRKSPYGANEVSLMENGNVKCFTSGSKCLFVNEELIDGECLFVNDGGTADIKYHNGPACYTNHVLALKINSTKCNGIYVYNYLLSKLDRINSSMFIGCGLKNLAKEDFLNFDIPLPDINTQNKIANIFFRLDVEIEKIEKLLIKLQEIKRSLLSSMFPLPNRDVPQLRFEEFTEAWEQRKLSDLCGSFEYGLNAAAKEFDGKNKYIRITDIDDTSREFSPANLSSPDIYLEGLSKYLLSSGDIVFARTGASVGKTYIYKEKDGTVYFAGFLIRAKVDGDNDTEFVFQSTLSSNYEKYIRIISQRSGQPGVNAQEYGEYPMFAPQKEEQQKIGRFLRGLDTLITLHQRKLDKYRQIKSAMLNKLLA